MESGPRIVRQMLSGLTNLLYPADGQCPFCGGFVTYLKFPDFCLDCRLALLASPGFLNHWQQSGSLRFAGADRGERTVPLICCGEYEDPLQGLVHQLKYRNRTWLSRPLGALLWRRLLVAGVTEPVVVVPVPLSRARERRRGFNQSALLATELAMRLRRASGIDAALCHLLTRHRHTRPQVGLPLEKRVQNVVGAFSVHERLAQRLGRVAFVGEGSGGTIILLDDVVTTGTTAKECASVLARAGFERLVVAAVCRLN